MTEQEYLESIGQVTIFDVLSDETFKVGNDVRILLADEKEYELDHNYLKYYYPHVVNKIGRIVQVKGDSYQVYVQGEYLWLREFEMELVE